MSVTMLMQISRVMSLILAHIWSNILCHEHEIKVRAEKQTLESEPIQLIYIYFTKKTKGIRDVEVLYTDEIHEGKLDKASDSI